jgi:hypothetical protein
MHCRPANPDFRQPSVQWSTPLKLLLLARVAAVRAEPGDTVRAAVVDRANSRQVLHPPLEVPGYRILGPNIYKPGLEISCFSAIVVIVMREVFR